MGEEKRNTEMGGEGRGIGNDRGGRLVRKCDALYKFEFYVRWVSAPLISKKMYHWFSCFI